MSQPVFSCPKCGSEMESGVFDRSLSSGHVHRSMDERTTQEILVVLFTSENVTKSPKSGETIPVGTFRCRSCGFLESYARDEFAVKWI